MKKLAIFLGVFLTLTAFADYAPANRPYDAQHYTVTLEIDPSTDPKQFQAETVVKLKATKPLETLSLDIDNLTVTYVQMNSPTRAPLQFEVVSGKELKVAFPSPLKVGQAVTLHIAYAGKVDTANAGFFKVTDPDEPNRGPLLFTHFEPGKARAFFPCNDEPYDKATTELKVTVPGRYDVVSNGKKTRDKKFHREGKPWREIHWKQDLPHSTYLVALAIGPFAKVATKYKGKEVSFYVGETKKDRVAPSLEATTKSIEFFEKYTGVPYPWAKYASVGLPTFLWGGMENTASTFMNQDRMLLTDPNSSIEKKWMVGLIVHELAHQWFGDYVTMKWWEDIWLNESFANHLGTLATKNYFKNEGINLEVVTDTWDNYFRQEDGPRSHPIVNKNLTGADDAFDSINYTKGENVLRMLSYYIGEDKFKLGLKTYLTTHKLANADYTEFFAAMEKASGKDLAAFRDTWLLQRGYPVLTTNGTWDEKQKTFAFTLSQRSNHANDRAIFNFRVPVVFHRKTQPAFSKAVDVLMEGPRATQTLNLPAEPEWVTVNPGGVVLAKVLPEEGKESVLVTLALNDPDLVARTWAAYALLAPLKEGRSLSNTAEKTLSQMLLKDPSPYVKTAIVGSLHSLKVRWLPETLSKTLVFLARESLTSAFERTSAFTKDPHGWREWRSELLGSLGKVKQPETIPLLASALGRERVSLDDLSKAATAVAMQGNERSAEILKTALKLHEGRGYRYKYMVQFAFGALATPAAAQEIRELTKTCGSDLIGRISRLVRDNQVLVESSEWSQFLKEFVLEDTKFGDEVKARLLTSIEEVKNRYVRATLESIVGTSSSDRLREAARKILEKNYTGNSA